MVNKYSIPAALILALALIFFTAFVFTDAIDSNEGSADRFWISKAKNTHQYDLVILGDSRSYRGVAPQALEQGLPCLRSYNFAFSSGGLNGEIFAHANNMLDNASHHKAVLMGVAPCTLVASSIANKQYNEQRRKPWSTLFERKYIDGYFKYFGPISFGKLYAKWTGKGEKAAAYTSKYHDENGWVASAKFPEDTTEAIPLYREEFEKGKVEANLEKGLIAQTIAWTTQGIKVFGFRPPTTFAMLQLENEMSGFDESAFVRDFTAAGGTWLPIDMHQYHSYDGSHIDSVSALKLSKDLSQMIAKSIPCN